MLLREIKEPAQSAARLQLISLSVQGGIILPGFMTALIHGGRIARSDSHAHETRQTMRNARMPTQGDPLFLPEMRKTQPATASAQAAARWQSIHIRAMAKDPARTPGAESVLREM